MAHTSEFDLDELILALHPFIDSHPEGSREKEAFTRARAALLYIQDRGQEDDFARYRENMSSTTFTIRVAREFSTRQEADEWLSRGEARHRDHIKIAGRGFLVVQLPDRLTLIDRPLPEELASEEWEEDSE